MKTVNLYFENGNKCFDVSGTRGDNIPGDTTEIRARLSPEPSRRGSFHDESRWLRPLLGDTNNKQSGIRGHDGLWEVFGGGGVEFHGLVGCGIDVSGDGVLCVVQSEGWCLIGIDA